MVSTCATFVVCLGRVLVVGICLRYRRAAVWSAAGITVVYVQLSVAFKVLAIKSMI